MPVRLFSGARGSRISFHMLHRDDQVRVKQQLVCPAEGKVVGHDQIVKGYEYSKGEYVVIEPAEIKKIEPKTAKVMEILEFVRAAEVDPVYFEASYYLRPEEAGQRPYALLSKVMKERGYFAVAKLTMHNREYTVVLRPHRGGMMLHTMFYVNEVRQMELFSEPADLREAELKVAQQLIEALETNWDPSKFHDTFEENLKKLIQARLEGKEISPVEKPHKLAPPVDLMAALKESLERIQKKPPQSVAEVPPAESAPAPTPRKRPAGKAKRAA